MELGQKLRQARQEAGLSQRELCAGEITRNMLSLIENGTARPSMKTLTLLAQRLGKPVSWFLEETAVVSPNTPIMEQARQAYDSGDWKGAVEVLGNFTLPDAVYSRERDLIWALCHLAMAEDALDSGRISYARQLLEQAETGTAYCGEALRRKKLLLLGRAGERVSGQLPSLDAELQLRGREALEAGDARRGAEWLDACEDHEAPNWNLLRGDVFLTQKNWQEAARCFHKAEAAFLRETVPKLEVCYREMGDFQMAYQYACKGR